MGKRKLGYTAGSNRLGGNADEFDYDALSKPPMPAGLADEAAEAAAPPPSKKARKSKAKATDDPAEKRQARFKPKAPAASIERAERALSQVRRGIRLD